MQLDGRDVTFLLRGDSDQARSISVLLPDRSREQVIWSFEEAGHEVTKHEYEKLFGLT